jgi:Bacterial Ig domain
MLWSTSPEPLTTKLDKALSITPAQLLAATGGATPVAFGAPANGKLTYGPSGTMVYTANKGYSGTDQFQVTTSDAVKLYAVDTPPITTIGGVEIKAVPAARPSRRFRESTTRSTE